MTHAYKCIRLKEKKSPTFLLFIDTLNMMVVTRFATFSCFVPVQSLNLITLLASTRSASDDQNSQQQFIQLQTSYT